MKRVTKHARSSLARSYQRGATLLEVMIAVLVLAIGMLGIAALQATALRNSQSSFERSQAVILTYSLLDAMRADMDNARAGAYDTGGMLCAAPAAGGSLRNVQLSAWFGNLRAPIGGLGDTACAQAVSLGGGQYEVTIQWDDSRGTQGAVTESLVTRSRI